MTKLFKNSKQVLSFVLAFAVLAVSLFTGVVINSDAACDDSTVIYWDGSVTSVSSFNELGGKGTSDEPYIIDSVADLALIAGATIDSANLYFKVADGIDAIVLQSESVGAGILELTSASAVKDYFEDTSETGFVEWVRGGWSTLTPFIGSFDGNGVEIYGLYANTPNYVNPLAGLFTQIDAGAAISNVTVKNSYINSKSYAAFIAPFSGSNSQGLKTTGTVSFSQCIVANCYMVSNVDNCTNKAGVMTGTMNDYINMSNCMVYGNDANNVAVPYKDDSSIKGFKLSLVGDLENVKDPVDSITNCICLGTTPYPQYNCGFNNLVGPNASMFSNVYTDQATEDISLYLYDGASAAYKYYDKASQVIADSLTSITESQILSKNAMYVMPNLDWENIWLVEEGKMPEFRSNHNMSSTATAGTDGHTYKCADCDLVSVEFEHTYGADGKCTACGATIVCGSGVVEVWGDTKSTLTGETTVHETTGTAEPRWYDNTFELLDPNAENSETNPYIIDSAEGLAWLATKETAAETTGKWYKVADGIKAFNMNTVVDMSGDMTAAEVEAALDTTCQMKTWWSGNFAGSFDGNGITIYGVQGWNTQHNGSGSLFGKVEAGATFKNFELKNSYFKGDRAGSIFDNANGTGTITVENVVLTGNVLVSSRSNTAESYGGVMFARAVNNRVDVKNCLVYGNIAKHQGFYGNKTGYDVTYGMMGNSSKVDGVASRIENTIILDCLPYTAQYSYGSTSEMVFSNVYTNMLDVEVTNTMREGNTDADSYTTTYTGGIISQGDGKYKIVVELGNKDNSGKTTDLSKTVGAGSFYAVTADGIKGAAGKAAMENLDWASTWFAVEGGMPELRAFHTGFEAATDNGDGTHSESCNCGLKGVAAEHTFDKTAADSKCTDCGAECTHGQELGGLGKLEFKEETPETCTSVATGDYACSDCGLVYLENTPEFKEDGSGVKQPAGHKFEDVEKIPADCQGAGTIAHKLCTVCDNAFATTAAIDEPIENALDSTVDPIKAHTAKTDSKGDILYNMNESGHSKTCSVCEQEFDAEAHASDNYAADKEGHTGACSICKLATSGKEAHVFGDDSKCDICNWACESHTYVDGETITLYWECTEDVCQEVEQICTICGQYGAPRTIGHVEGDWITNERAPSAPACASDGYHTEIKMCSVCNFYEFGNRQVTDPKTGHQFVEHEEEAPTCTMVGTIAHKTCDACWGTYAIDAADDEPYENALNPYDGSMSIDVNPEAHVWVEYESTATCEEDGVAAHKFCADCYLFVVNGEETDVMIDWDAFWAYDEETGEPIGIGAKLDASYGQVENEAFAAFIAEKYPDAGIEVPAYPEDPNDWDAMGAYYDEYYAIWDVLFEIDENWQQAWGEYSQAYSAKLWTEAYYAALLSAAEEAEVDMTAEATGHTLVKVDEVAATYEADGVKAHYVCENCDKLFADENGTEEVTAEELVIAKLVKAEENKPSTDDKEDDKTDGDNSDKSPATGESIAVVAAVAALMGAAFVLVRKARKA